MKTELPHQICNVHGGSDGGGPVALVRQHHGQVAPRALAHGVAQLGQLLELFAL